MKKIIIILFYIIFFLGNFLKLSGNPQEDMRINFIEKIHGGIGSLDKKKIKIPFIIKGPHLIIIRGRINNNKQKESFIFDTSGQTMFDTSNIKKYKLNPNKLKQNIYIAKLNNIEFNGVIIKEYSPFFLSFKKKFNDLIKIAGVDLQGMIGCDLFRFFRITIDYRNKFIILTDTKKVLVNKNIKPKPMRMRILFPYHPSVKVVINDKKGIDGRIDTGFQYALGLPMDMIDKLLSENEKKKLIKSKGAFALWAGSKKKYNYLFRLKKIKIGNIVLKNQTVIFGELPKALGNNYIILGKTFLENYKTTIDFEERRLFLSAVKNNNKSLSYSIGINIVKDKNRTFVKGVWENSPADKKGIKVGSLVLRINEIPTKNISATTIFNLLLDKSVKKIKLRIKQTGGKIITPILVKKEL